MPTGHVDGEAVVSSSSSSSSADGDGGAGAWWLRAMPPVPTSLVPCTRASTATCALCAHPQVYAAPADCLHACVLPPCACLARMTHNEPGCVQIFVQLRLASVGVVAAGREAAQGVLGAPRRTTLLTHGAQPVFAARPVAVASGHTVSLVHIPHVQICTLRCRALQTAAAAACNTCVPPPCHVTGSTHQPTPLQGRGQGRGQGLVWAHQAHPLPCYPPQPPSTAYLPSLIQPGMQRLWQRCMGTHTARGQGVRVVG